MDFHGISDLKAIRKFNWKIKVRVIHKWCERNHFTGRRNGMNLILVDETGDRVHAWLGEAILRYFDKILIVDHAYIIKNFTVKYYEPSDGNRCFDDEQHIILSCFTRAYRIKEDICNIPFTAWKFSELGKLKDLDDYLNHFIDVVGLVYSVDPAQSLPTNTKDTELVINFCIMDNIHKVNVTFSGKIAASFDMSLNRTTELPAVIAISSCKCCKMNESEEKCIFSTESTKFTLNPTLDIVPSLRKRFWDMHGG